MHILLDIEALGLRPGSAIIELAAVAFDPATGLHDPPFHALIRPDAPLHADLETLAWHAEKGTWPRTPYGDLPLRAALVGFNEWTRSLDGIDAFWAWGATYDFPLLTAAYDACDIPPAWGRGYWQLCCARTVWRVAFGDRRRAPRPHHALEDARAAARDLIDALASLAE